MTRYDAAAMEISLIIAFVIIIASAIWEMVQ